MDFSNQTQVFPDVPPDQNPYQDLLQQLESTSSLSGTALQINLYFYVVIFGLGVALVILLLALDYIYSRKIGTPLRFIRRVNRPEGTYFAVENSTFIPITTLLYWGFLFAAMMLDILALSNPAFSHNISLWSQIPFPFMFIQVHGFACGMLVGAIVTYSEVLGKNTNSSILPVFFNSLQPFLAMVLIVVNIVFTSVGNTAYNKITDAAFQLALSLSSASSTWVEGLPLNVTVAEDVYQELSTYKHANIVNMPKMRNIWISWLFTCSVPLAIIVLSAIVILRGVHVHVANMKKSGLGSGLETEDSNEIAVDNATIQSEDHQASMDVQRVRKNFVQLRDLERKLVFRITIVTLPSLAATVCLIAFLHDFTYDPSAPISESGLSKVNVVTSYVFPWASILSVVNGIIIGYWLYSSLTQWRILLASKKKSQSNGVKITYTSSQLEHVDRSPPLYIDLQESDHARKREYFANMMRHNNSSSSAKFSVEPSPVEQP